EALSEPRTISPGESHMDHCTFAYPTEDEAQEAVCHIARMANGDMAWDDACAVHCAWTLQGYQLSKGCEPCPCPDDLKAACAPLVGTHGLTAMRGLSIDWAKLIADVLAAILGSIKPKS